MVRVEILRSDPGEAAVVIASVELASKNLQSIDVGTISQTLSGFAGPTFTARFINISDQVLRISGRVIFPKTVRANVQPIEFDLLRRILAQTFRGLDGKASGERHSCYIAT